jgi:heme A synthase
VMICSTIAIVIHSMQRADALGTRVAEAVVPINVVSLITIVLVSGLFAGAIANVSRPEVHKRLMVLVMVVLLQAAVARLVVQPLSPPGPPSLQTTVITGIVSDLLVVVAMVHDWRTRGRPHSVYVFGELLLLVVQVVLGPLLARSEAAAVFARSVQHLLG